MQILLVIHIGLRVGRLRGEKNCTAIHLSCNYLLHLELSFIFVVGLDVGYSNLKLAYGPTHSIMKTIVRTCQCCSC